MGTGTTNVLGRIMASFGKFAGAEPSFSPASDVTFGGVLFALPALLSTGLLKYTDQCFRLPKGYYLLESIFLFLAFMALCRIKTIEGTRYLSPGEWGNLLGLDRCPEAKTLRKKVALLSQDDRPSRWMQELSSFWMKFESEDNSVLYIDGHVQIYSGSQTKLPKHYVSRQKLCLRAVTDYWVNAMDGRPFFKINKAVDPGLVKVVEEDIVPKLEGAVSGQPTEKELEAHPLLHRLTLIFDREGYSPELFFKMKKLQIACMTYHKFPKEDWPHEEFFAYEIRRYCGSTVKMMLAERGIFLGKKIWLREIRRLNSDGHQTSIISSDYCSRIDFIAKAMFARWCQENFFKYMKNHYNLDALTSYSIEGIPDTQMVVNPEWRSLDSKIRSRNGKLNRIEIKHSKLTLNGNIEEKKVEKYLDKKNEMENSIASFGEEIKKLKEQRKGVDKHIEIGQLPEDSRFSQLDVQSKYLVDTIKIIAYRAETAMANALREKITRPDEARTLLTGIFKADADIRPNLKEKTLTISLHHLAAKTSSEAIRYLCDELNATETKFPNSDLRIIYKLVS